MSLSDERRAGALREDERFRAFCTSNALPVSHASVVLYLTEQLNAGNVHGPLLRNRLGLLDVAARVAGDPPWSASADMRRFIRGMYKKAPQRRITRDTRPLYIELVHAVVDGIEQPGLPQLRDTALLLLAHRGGLRPTQLWRLQWCDLRIRQNELVITTSSRSHAPPHTQTLPATGGPCCVVIAVRNLRRMQHQPVGSVFGNLDRSSINRTLVSLGHRSNNATTQPVTPQNEDSLIRAVNRALDLRPRQIRDKAIVLLAFAAYMTPQELARLRLTDVEECEQGLIVTVSGRQHLVGVRRAPDPHYCPVAAWRAWRQLRDRVLEDKPGAHAFVKMDDDNLKPVPMTPSTLNVMTATAARAAGLRGRWAFMSVRRGALRTAVRSGLPYYVIAQDAGLDSLTSVDVHGRREEMVRASITSWLGM